MGGGGEREAQFSREEFSQAEFSRSCAVGAVPRATSLHTAHQHGLALRHPRRFFFRISSLKGRVPGLCPMHPMSK